MLQLEKKMTVFPRYARIYEMYDNGVNVNPRQRKNDKKIGVPRSQEVDQDQRILRFMISEDLKEI